MHKRRKIEHQAKKKGSLKPFLMLKLYFTLLLALFLCGIPVLNLAVFGAGEFI
ncbi:MAG: hypothetical protein ACLFPX_08605 [Candidatus Omnitrophota bacterium]